MAGYIRNSLGSKLVIFFILVAVASISVVGYLSFSSSRSALMHAYYDKLVFAGEDRKLAILEFFEQATLDVAFLSKLERIGAAFGEIEAAGKDGQQAGTSTNRKGETALYKKIDEQTGRVLTEWRGLYEKKAGYQDVLLVTSDGFVAYTSKKEADLGEDLRTGALRDTGLARAWEKVVKTGKPALIDFSYYEPGRAVAGFAAHPYVDANGKLAGVVVVRLDTSGVNQTFAQVQGMGETAECYAVGQDFLMRSDSRFEKTSTILKKKCESDSAKAVMEGKTGFKIVKDYRGIPCLSAYAPLGLKQRGLADFDWAIIAEIDEEEVMRPVWNLAMKTLGIGAIVALLAAIAAYFVSQGIARPMTAIAGIVSEVSKGNLAVDVPVLKRSDEIGVLTNAFRVMVDNLRRQMTQMLEGVNVLSSAAAEITATAAQLATSATETSSAVNETTTTVEQVKQSAALARDKAAGVAQSAQEAYQVSEAGKKAVQETIQRMKLISEQMESVGETVVKLSEHSQTIEEIIETVQDLADQSNLLAVNASIEAARAGEQGKGFAVVAQEIKNLSDQSNQATDQVKSILGDTRKSVSAVVMATEQGSKAVQSGVEGSGQASGSIEDLATRVAASSQAASLIEASVQQQFVGVNQVSTAMLSIEQAVRQTLDGTTQLETAARRIEDLGGNLKEIVASYNLNGRPKGQVARN